jgi:CHAT domain
MPTKLLFLTANPKGTTTLRLDQEIRDITEGLQRAAHREAFKLESRWAVRPRDIQRALLDLNPQIVHFSGHGLGEPTTPDETTRKLNAVPEGLAFEDPEGKIAIASTEALATLFSLFKDSIQCVVLNACYSANQATAIAQHIPYVIGMNKAIGDKAAIEFAVSFYDALGAGRDIPFAYELAKNAIQLSGIPEHLTPVLESNHNPPITKPPTHSTLTPQKRRRLEQQQKDLQADWAFQTDKLKRWKESRAIESGTAVQFQLDKEIEAQEAKLKQLEEGLDRIEQELGIDDDNFGIEF